MRNIGVTNLLKYSIDLIKNARPVREKASKYSIKEKDFANMIFLAMKEASIITQKSSL